MPQPPLKTPMIGPNGIITLPWATYFRELDSGSGETTTTLGEHLADGTDAHDASAISNSPSGNVSATNVQAAINELDGQITALGALEGDSAYEVAVDNGFVGSEAEWLESLVGDTGATGATGGTGPQGSTGVQGPEGPPGGAINTQFAVNADEGFIYTNALTGHVYLLEVAS